MAEMRSELTNTSGVGSIVVWDKCRSGNLERVQGCSHMSPLSHYALIKPGGLVHTHTLHT